MTCYHVSADIVDIERLDLSTMNILEYEERVKRFAHPGNSAFLSIQ